MQGSLLMFFCAFSKSSLENQAQWIKHSQTYQRMFSKGFVKRNQTSKRFLYFRSSFMISIPRRCGCKDVDLSDPYLEDDPQYLVIRGSSAHGDRFRSLRIVGCGTTSKWQFTPWLINRGDRGDPNHLQVLGWSFKYEMLFPKVKSKALPCQAPPSPYSMQRCWHSAPWKRTKKTKRLCWVWTLCMGHVSYQTPLHRFLCLWCTYLSFSSERLAIQINFQVGPITYDLRFFFEPGDNARIRMWNE